MDFMDAAAARYAKTPEAVEEAREELETRVKAADIVNTMATPGWRLIMAEAEAAVRDQENKALDCADDSQVVRLQHEARAAREFLKQWRRRIEAAGQVAKDEMQSVSH